METGPQLKVGSIFGRYRIDGFVGRGAMGVVMRAHDLELARPVALKVLDADLVADRQARTWIHEESRLAASLDHPSILPIYEVGLDADPPFIAMRYVGGRDLARLLRDDAPLSTTTTVRIVGQIAAALDAAHRQGLLHGDVKPANVLIEHGPELVAYLADFGLSRRMTGDASTRHTSGTRGYVAPEMLSGGVVDGRADQYSLACVIEHCLTGRPPSPDGTTNGADVDVAWAPIPSALRRAVARGRSIDPRDRHPDCTALVRAVAAAGHVADEPGSGATAPVGAGGAVTGARRRPRRRTTVMVVIALMSIIALVGAGVILAVPGAPPPAPADPARLWEANFIKLAQDSLYANGWKQCALSVLRKPDRPCEPRGMACQPQRAGIQFEIGAANAGIKCLFGQGQPVLNAFLFDFGRGPGAAMWWSHDTLSTGKVGPVDGACRDGRSGHDSWLSGIRRGLVSCWFGPSGDSGNHWFLSWHEVGSPHTGLLTTPALDPDDAEGVSAAIVALDALWRSLPYPLGVAAGSGPVPVMTP